MKHEDAAKLRPGDLIDYRPRNTRGVVTAKVTGRIHLYLDQIVYVPVPGELVHHSRVVRKHA
jgi:hypothetical protein